MGRRISLLLVASELAMTTRFKNMGAWSLSEILYPEKAPGNYSIPATIGDLIWELKPTSSLTINHHCSGSKEHLQ